MRNLFLPKPDLSLAEAAGAAAVWMLAMFAPQGPLSNRYSAGFVLFFLFAALLSRSLWVIGGVTFGLSLACRFLFPISAWVDQRWIQWYSISSLLTGHNLYVGSPWVRMSMAAYMPLGDTFGGVFIALGMQKYWLVWHVIVCCLVAVPLIAAPSLVSLLVFIVTTDLYAFNDYTTGGGSLELGFALTVAAIGFYRTGYASAAVVAFAFAINLRQPAVVMAPFVFLLLWRDRDIRNMKLFGALLLLFGGLLVMLDLRGFYLSAIKLFDSYNQMYFNQFGGLLQNYSIASIPHFFGVDDAVPWFRWQAVYMPLLLASLGVLFRIGWRSRSRETILTLGVLATAFVFIFVRGYSAYHYLLAAVLPIGAVLTPQSTARPSFARYWAAGMSFLLLWIGLLPLTLLLAGRVEAAREKLGADPPVAVAKTSVLDRNGSPIVIPNLDGSDGRRRILSLEEKMEFTFAEPVRLSAIRLSGDHVQIVPVKGVAIPWATDTEAKGSIFEGELEWTEDGQHFRSLEQFENSATYSAFPVTLRLPRTKAGVRGARLSAKRLYLDQKEWILGNVEFFGVPVRPH